MTRVNSPFDKVRALQRALYVAAKRNGRRKFPALYDWIALPTVLRRAWEQVRRNKGAAGIDGETIQAVEAYGVERMLVELRALLASRRYRPQAARRAYISKPAGTRADFRGQFPAVFVWLSTEAERPRLKLPIGILVTELNPVLRGWGNYFRWGNSSRKFSQIDGYVQERLALFDSKKRHRSGRRWGEVHTSAWVSRLGVHRLSGTVRYA